MENVPYLLEDMEGKNGSKDSFVAYEDLAKSVEKIKRVEREIGKFIAVCNMNKWKTDDIVKSGPSTFEGVNAFIRNETNMDPSEYIQKIASESISTLLGCDDDYIALQIRVVKTGNSLFELKKDPTCFVICAQYDSNGMKK